MKKRGRPFKVKDAPMAESEEYKGGAPEPSSMKDAMGKEEPAEHEKESWMRTLMDAEDIKKDEHKMKHMHAHMESKMGKMKSIQDLKDYAQAKYAKKPV